MKHAKKKGFEDFCFHTKRILKAIWFILNLLAVLKTLFD